MMTRRLFLQGLGGLAVAPAFALASPLPSGIDSHAHVFTAQLKLAERRRYSVDYDATPAAYLSMLRANGLGRGVLVQPSFLGFDNRYLVAALKAHRGQLRGIAALAREASSEDMQSLARSGVVGIRLNLLGRSDPDLSAPAWQRHFARVRALGWQVEVQCEARRLPRLVPPLLKAGVTVVIDHFGRPDAALGVADPGFRYLLRSAQTGAVYVKLSGAYRVGEALADAAAPMLLAAFGPERLVWGSDWPHTQFETVATAAGARSALDRWVPAQAARQRILNDTPQALFKFETAQAHAGRAHA